MILDKFIVELVLIAIVDSLVIGKENKQLVKSEKDNHNVTDVQNETNLSNVFDGVYTECFLHLSYSCLQRKTLCYLKELNKLSEVPILGDYVKFVKLNTTENDSSYQSEELSDDENSEELSFMIDKAVDQFFNNHIMKFNALGRNLSFSNTEEFVGRKKRKGGGGGDSGGGHEEFFKKKMMMMAMMCMKMKFMMMMPAMMGMMGMMSFKGMMFSMMSFMLSKMMLLMKLLEKKGGGFGGGGGGGGDGGWAAGGGGGGAWMPAGGQDYGGGGGYDANGQWQSRSIIEKEDANIENKPVISYVIPTISYNNKPILAHKDNYETIKNNGVDKVKSRKKRGIIDVIQNAYLYWINSILGNSIKRRLNYPRYKLINGVRYVYYPNKTGHKLKTLLPSNSNSIKNNEEFKPIIIVDDFNKGETVEGAVVSRMNRKKFNKMKDALNDTIEDNPWQ